MAAIIIRAITALSQAQNRLKPELGPKTVVISLTQMMSGYLWFVYLHLIYCEDIHINV